MFAFLLKHTGEETASWAKVENEITTGQEALDPIQMPKVPALPRARAAP
jgi:hypothetical protein